MSQSIKLISSMATAGLLKELCPAASQVCGVTVAPESIGGVDATRRVQSGENFDIVIMADRLIDQLIEQGHVRAGTRGDLAQSKVAIAVAQTASAPDVSSEEALKDALLNANAIGYSTGPSGVAIVQMIEDWGLSAKLKDKMIESKPGVLVGSLIAQGKVEIGFQQMSELMHLPDIQIIGTMPPGAEIETVFSAGLCTSSEQPAIAQQVIDFLCSDDAAQAKRNQGMAPL
jgi:molybdate transport system substrate-binding protein